MSHRASSTFTCNDCGRTVGRRSDLNRHMRIHDPHARRYPCPVPDCDYKPLQRSNLAMHLRTTHLEDKTFRCDVAGCSASYSHPSAVGRHKKAKHGHAARRERTPYERRPSRNHTDLNNAPTVRGAPETLRAPSLGRSSAGILPPTPSTLPTPSLGPPVSFEGRTLSGSPFITGPMPLYPRQQDEPSVGSVTPASSSTLRTPSSGTPFVPFEDQILSGLPFVTGPEMPLYQTIQNGSLPQAAPGYHIPGYVYNPCPPNDGMYPLDDLWQLLRF